MARTKFGVATINKKGYYQITSRKEGNKGKYLHRLIWETHHKISIPTTHVIHHINDNPLDNRIQNLQCVEKGIHSQRHNKNKKNDRKAETRTFKSKHW